MKENIYYTELFDIYGTLLTDKQQEYFKDSQNRNENGELKEMYTDTSISKKI